MCFLPLDVAPGLGNPWLYFDGRSGLLVKSHIPGKGTAGDIFHQLQYPMHGGQIIGLPGRILICVSGLVVAVLSVTGVVIWWKKRGMGMRKGSQTCEVLDR